MDPAGDPDDVAAPGSRPWLTRNLVVLSGVSLLQDTASELLYPIIPIFLTSVLGAPLVVVGAVEGVAEAVAAGAKIAAGWLSDRVGRRPLVAGGYALAAVGKLVIAVAFAWPVVLVGRAVDRLGKGVRGAPRDALLVEDVAAESRGRAFGFHRAADTTGAVIGPLIGLAGYEAFHHRIRPLLVLAVGPAVVSALLVAAVREQHPPAPRVRAVGTSRAALPVRFWRVVVATGLFGLVNFPDALLLLRVRALGFSVPGVILVYVAYNSVYAVASFPAGLLSDRLSAPRVYALGLACFAICYLGLGAISDGRWVWPLFVVYGCYAAATDGVGKAWVSVLVPVLDHGRAQGVFQGLAGGATLVAGLWAGLLWHGSGRFPLVLSGAVALVIAAVVVASPSLRLSLDQAPSPRPLTSTPPSGGPRG